MKISLSLLIYLILPFSITHQSYKSIDVEFMKNGKKIVNAQYYYLHQDTAYQLPYKHNKLNIDNQLLKSPNIILLAIYEGKVINFKVETNSFYYIKINGYKHGFKTIYRVNYGSEYDELIKPYSANKVVFNR